VSTQSNYILSYYTMVIDVIIQLYDRATYTLSRCDRYTILERCVAGCNATWYTRHWRVGSKVIFILLASCWHDVASVKAPPGIRDWPSGTPNIGVLAITWNPASWKGNRGPDKEVKSVATSPGLSAPIGAGYEVASVKSSSSTQGSDNEAGSVVTLRLMLAVTPTDTPDIGEIGELVAMSPVLWAAGYEVACVNVGT
jgi:hypothetical protein